MLKRMSLKKLLVCFLALFSLGILHFIPNTKLETKQELEYVSEYTNPTNIYLENKDHYLTRVNINVKNNDVVKKAREVIETLISDKKNNIPKGFKSVIPKNTTINSIKHTDDTIKIDFSKELLDVSKNKEEKVIEAIVYTLTNIEDVKYVIIYINGEILSQLPKSKITLPATLDRSFGINKEYQLTSDKNISKTTVYYISTYHNKEYYVPVTKVNNDSRDKIEIIVEELSNNHFNNNLMSYLNNNTKLISSNIDKDNISLVFNESIINDNDKQNILDEVIYTICLSINDNYDTSTVSFKVDDHEITKTVLKSLE